MPWPCYPTPLCTEQRIDGAGLARTQMCWTFPPFAFLIAEKFIRSQTIVCSKMSGGNNQAASAAVSLLLLNGLLNGTRWCLGALLRQMIDVSLALQAEIWGAKEIKDTLGTQKSTSWGL